jgi:hypothetical protein
MKESTPIDTPIAVADVPETDDLPF